MTNPANNSSRFGIIGTSLMALGIVFGDIGTSPLYALRECFSGSHGIALTQSNIFGVVSLVFWSLVLVISIKYLLYVMYADNKGEGGVFALMVLALNRGKRIGPRTKLGIVGLGLFGGALIYGDGMITPAISVLSALEGVHIATPLFDPFILPLTTVILVLLFLNQKHGAGKIGKLFGPIILLWFVFMGTSGLFAIIQTPSILYALLPTYAVTFFLENGPQGLIVLGSIFLAVTGGEALYADMGHFGRYPIKLAWFLVACPGLLLNYFGQGALLLARPEAIANPFFHLVPHYLLYPAVLLATLACVIASQALISGVFSLTRQAIQLGYFPRIAVLHTSHKEIGQIYVPFINAGLLVCCVALVWMFKTSGALAGAYGVAVTLTMAVTTILIAFVAKLRWHWPTWLVVVVTGLFLSIDIAFMIPNLIKVAHGGWVTLVVAAVMVLIMSTWSKGREILTSRLAEKTRPLSIFIAELMEKSAMRVEGVGVYMTRETKGVPPILLHNFLHNRVLHSHILLLKVHTEDSPVVDADKRVTMTHLGEGFYDVTLSFGFTETPDVPAILAQITLDGSRISAEEVTYFLGRETVLATTRKGMAQWREQLFSFMSRNVQRAPVFFKIPSNQVIEIGLQIEM